jgi:hypothetical protein
MFGAWLSLVQQTVPPTVPRSVQSRRGKSNSENAHCVTRRLPKVSICGAIIEHITVSDRFNAKHAADVSEESISPAIPICNVELLRRCSDTLLRHQRIHDASQKPSSTSKWNLTQSSVYARRDSTTGGGAQTESSVSQDNSLSDIHQSGLLEGPSQVQGPQMPARRLPDVPCNCPSKIDPEMMPKLTRNR